MDRQACIAFVVAIGLALIPTDADAQVYKCTVNGKTVYQGLPCKNPTRGKAIHVDVPPRSSQFTEAEWILIGKQQVAVGMSKEALLQSWGKPTEINRSSYGAAQWVYRRGPAAAQYVYVEDGKVTAWSD